MKPDENYNESADQYGQLSREFTQLNIVAFNMASELVHALHQIAALPGRGSVTAKVIAKAALARYGEACKK